MNPTITLTILTNSFAEFKKQAATAATFSNYIQIDVMDGKFVPNKSFTERNEINALNLPLKYELHLMVADPVAEMHSWLGVKNIFRLLFPVETGNTLASITTAKKFGWQVGLTLNPETPLTKIEPFLSDIDVVQFMTVHPGRQGAPFEESVLEKIKALSQAPNHPPISVDGGVNPDTAPRLAAAGVSIYNVGSFFTKAPDMGLAYQELNSLLKHENIKT